uniref:C2H2-type domain-containing protein n=1 Tax=Podarcis muralis TaxID=64176 RepID=A0A670JKX2_PODMU
MGQSCPTLGFQRCLKTLPGHVASVTKLLWRANTSRPHRCTACTKRFKTPYELQRHMLTHCAERPFACTACGKGFAAAGSSYLAIHARSHTGERPYACGVCGKAFARPSLLLQHQRVHSTERPHRCRHCSKLFKDLAYLNHMKVHLSKLGLQSEQRGPGPGRSAQSLLVGCEALYPSLLSPRPTDKASTGNFLGYGDASCAERLQATARAVESGQQWRERSYAGGSKLVREDPGGSHRCPDCSRTFGTFQQMALHRQSHLSREREWSKGQSLGSHLLAGHWLPTNVRASTAANTSPSLLTQEEKGKYGQAEHSCFGIWGWLFFCGGYQRGSHISQSNLRF